MPLQEEGQEQRAFLACAAMVQEASTRAAQAGLSDRATFTTSDLEALEGKYDTVTAAKKGPSPSVTAILLLAIAGKNREYIDVVPAVLGFLSFVITLDNATHDF